MVQILQLRKLSQSNVEHCNMQLYDLCHYLVNQGSLDVNAKSVVHIVLRQSLISLVQVVHIDDLHFTGNIVLACKRNKSLRPLPKQCCHIDMGPGSKKSLYPLYTQHSWLSTYFHWGRLVPSLLWSRSLSDALYCLNPSRKLQMVEYCLGTVNHWIIELLNE